jgi:hypothetical protein
MLLDPEWMVVEEPQVPVQETVWQQPLAMVLAPGVQVPEV